MRRVDPTEFCGTLSSGNGDLFLGGGNLVDLPSDLAANDPTTCKIRFIMSAQVFTVWDSERFPSGVTWI